MQVKILDKLKPIREGITNQIKLQRKTRSTGYNLVLFGLTTAISWVESLMNFINETYAELIWSSFFSSPAWGLTTRLVVRIFKDIPVVIARILSTFVSDNKLSNGDNCSVGNFSNAQCNGGLSNLEVQELPICLVGIRQVSCL